MSPSFWEIWSEINQSRDGRDRLPPHPPSFPPLILQVFGMPAAPNRVTGRNGTGPAPSP